MPFDPSTAVAEPTGVKFDASTAVPEEQEPQSNSPMPPERGFEPTGEITAETPSLYARGKEAFGREMSPLFGPTESQRSEGMVPFGRDADGRQLYQYKPLASRIEREGLLMTPLLESPRPFDKDNPAPEAAVMAVLGASGLGGVLPKEIRSSVAHALINTAAGIGTTNLLNILSLIHI